MTTALSEALVAGSRWWELSLLLKATLVLGAGAVLATLARRAPAALRHLFLAATFFAVLVLPVGALLAPSVRVPVHVSGPVAEAPSHPGPTASAPSTRERTQRKAGLGEAPPGATGPAAAPSASWPSVQTLLRGVWVAGAVLLLAGTAVALGRLYRIRRRALPWIEGRVLMRTLAAQAGVGRPVDLVISEKVAAPLTCGFHRPSVILPADATGWSEADLRRALVHELEHVARGDWPVQLMARAACALYWFHPLAWVAWRRLGLEAERACDDAVVRVADEADYAEQLVTLARRLSTATRPALAMASRSDLSRRVAAVLDAGLSRAQVAPVHAAAVVASFVVLVGMVAPLRAVAAPEAVNAPVETESEREDRGDRRGVSRALGRALVESAEHGDVREVQDLLEGGADVDTALVGDGTPLIVAARAGHLDVVRLLLEHGADVDLPVGGDGNPLIMAAREGHLEVVELLLDRGASIDMIVPEDENALIQAAGSGHLGVVRLLVTRGADVNARAFAERAFERPRGEWRTPLSMARKGGHDEVVRFLRAAGARE